MRKDSLPSHFVFPPILVFSFFSALCAIGSAAAGAGVEPVAESVAGSITGSTADKAVGAMAATVQQVNINTASAKQLAAVLSGVGERRAEAIVAYRQSHGPFRKRADLARVKGISAATVSKNKDRIVLK